MGDIHTERNNGEEWYDPSQKKNGSKNWVNLEDMRVGMLYAITVNPPKQDHVSGKAYMLTEVELMLARANTLVYSRLEVYPELSPAGRLHFHGFIIPEDIFGFYSYDIHRIEKWGNFKICEINDEPVKGYKDWYSYCTKQEKIMKPAFEALALKYKCVNSLLKTKVF